MSEGRGVRQEEAGKRQAAAGVYAGEQRGRGRHEKQEIFAKLRQLPGALTDAGLTLGIKELPVGARLAADTVYKCWCEGKFADDEFISFLQSISTYSPALMLMMRPMMQDQMMAAGKPMPGIPLRVGVVGGGQFSGAAVSNDLTHAVPVPPPISEESQAAMGINKEWRSRRRKEAARRQCAGIEGSEHDQRVGYLCRTFSCLRHLLPPSALPTLLDTMIGFSCRRSSPEAFGQHMQDLVDTYQLVVPLDYIPQRAYGETSAGDPKRGLTSMRKLQRVRVRLKLLRVTVCMSVG